jgi:hypothetical protein
VLLVKGEANRADIIRKMSGWLASNYYWHRREQQYYGIKPRIVIEECLKNADGSPPLDYKIYCFNGRPDVILVRNHTRDICPFFDATWKFLDFSDVEGAVRPRMPRPANLEEMVALAANLSAGFGFVRVDLYNVMGRVYFGELTFTPRAGLMKYDPEYWDSRLGEKWELSIDC